MTGDGAMLIAMNALMFLGSFLPGYLPLALMSRASCSAANLHLISALGAGLLVGTALMVILPEGVVKLFSGSVEHPEGYIGLSLAGGFVFMLIVEQLSAGQGDSHSHLPSHRDDNEMEVETLERPGNLVPVIGLIVHSAVDGIALGSVMSSHLRSMEMIVFFALILHKAPAAFGLSMFLLQQKRPHRKIIKSIAWFSAAAPILSFITYIFLTLDSNYATSAPEEAHDHSSDSLNLAICLLFSAGTFLFSATMHILPEIKANGLGWKEVVVITTGILAPAFISIEHEH